MKAFQSSRSAAVLHVISHLTIQISNSVTLCKYFIKLIPSSHHIHQKPLIKCISSIFDGFRKSREKAGRNKW